MRPFLLVCLLVLLLGCPEGTPVEPPSREQAVKDESSGDVQAKTEAVAGPDSEEVFDERRVEVRLEHASHEVPDGGPHAVVHVPQGFRVGDEVHVVVFLHGWRGCARALAAEGRVGCVPGGPPTEGWGLVDRHAAAETNTVLLVPQLAWRARDGSPGRLAEEGFFAAMSREIFAGPLAEMGVEPGPITLVAHSAGYESALAILEHGGVRVQNVVLLDALYAGAAELVRWAAGDDSRRLISLHTGRGKTRRQSLKLARLARQAMGAEAIALDPDLPLAEAVPGHRVVVMRSPHPHGAIPRRQLEEALRALPLPAR